MLELNDVNYYSLEANQQYMSNSQYGDFRRCEAMAMAKLAGWSEEPSVNMLAGSFVHAWNEGPEALKKFKDENPDIFTRTGELKANFRAAEKMIQTLERDPKVMFALRGQKEVIFAAEMFGCWWKCKIDSYNPEDGWLTDLKATRDLLAKEWIRDDYKYVHFIEAYGYDRQMALYLEIERMVTGRDHWLDPYMVLVTSQDPPDKMILTFNPERRLKDALASVERNMPRILAVKLGQEEPTRCDACAYCRETKLVDKVWDYDRFLWERF